ncbi:hypothetical protein [Demequina mangrovi]|uniref:Polymorphic outer membrane protein repeat-containing protein n=1 Tax=Demequina mangrovi TaxID=1043493 RepID=A0A1H6ZC19_9MICO|nr:hypothetical protein [Demequina mangrovi]SEJ50276.1 hypothetical protein SAMN05421637_2042 [Demequina mangrovi]
MRTGRTWLASAAAATLLVALGACTAPPDPSRHSPHPSLTADVPEARAAVPVEPAITASAEAPTRDFAAATRVIPADAATATGETGVVRTARGRTVVGDGTSASCTAAALARAAARGGLVSFDCGGEARIVLHEPLALCATAGCDPEGPPVGRLRIDGGGQVTLVGGGATRLIEARGCAEDGAGCDGASGPHLVLTRIELEGGVAPAVADDPLGLGGGGAIAMVGGRLTLGAVTLDSNSCADAETGTGGAVLAQGMTAAVVVRGSAFVGNACGSGGALAVVDAPLRVSGSTLVDNTAEVAGGGLLVRNSEADAEVSMALMVGNSAPAGPSIEHDPEGGGLTVRDSRIEPANPAPEAVAVVDVTD